MVENKPFSDNVSKRSLWKYVNKKIKRSIHYYHVFSIISILFEEILKDLQEEKELKVFNFGTLVLKKTNPKKYHNVRYQKVMQAEAHKLMKFSLAKKIRNKLCKYLDLDATFKGD